MTDVQLAEIEGRDSATADGVSTPDYACAADRHVLLAEVRRLRALTIALRTGRPVAD